MRVIGIDPGLAATGWAVLDPAQDRPRVVACGTIRTSAADEVGARLALIARGLRAAIAAHAPAVAAVEQALVARGARSALALGEARGVALLAAAEAGLEIHQYLPMHVGTASSCAVPEETFRCVRNCISCRFEHFVIACKKEYQYFTKA